MFGNRQLALANQGDVRSLSPAPMGMFRYPRPHVRQGFGDGVGAHVPSGRGKPISPPAPASLEAQEAKPGHWTVNGFDSMRSAIPAQQVPMPQAPPPVPQQGGALGGSIRQPFDYEAAYRDLAGEQKKISPWRWGAAALADFLTLRTGGTPGTLRHLAAQQQGMEDRRMDATRQLADWRYRDFTRQNEADLKAANPFTIGRDRLAYDPATGQASMIYDGPDDFDLYASALGLEEGTDEYFQAVEDYVLRSSGPSAHGRDLEADDHRTGNDASLEELRQRHRAALERLRQDNRRSLESQRQGNRVTLRQTPQARSRGNPASRPVSVTTPQEAQALPKGTRYTTPDGQVYTR